MSQIIHLYTNIAPHYRQSLWKNLLNNTEYTFKIFYGINTDSGIEQFEIRDEQNKYSQKLENKWFKKKVLVWQKGVIKSCTSHKMSGAIFLGDMYTISTWLAVLICKLRGIEVIFWSHGLYGNENFLKKLTRIFFYRLADKHLLYERRAKGIMVREGFAPNKLYIIFNSLDYSEHLKNRKLLPDVKKESVFNFFSKPSLPTLIFIGRLTAVKKLDFLISCVKEINFNKPKMNLVIIGDGPLRKKLEALGKTGLQENWLHFTGACYEEKEIGLYLSRADLCVSPGNVGLTAVHSLSYGTPVCTHGNLNNQMPEAGIISDGNNGFYFKENDRVDFISKITGWFSSKKERDIIREKCYEMIDKYYNPNYQMEVLNALLRKENPKI